MAEGGQFGTKMDKLAEIWDLAHKHAHYLRREFAYTNFEQKYTLPDNVDEGCRRSNAKKARPLAK